MKITFSFILILLSCTITFGKNKSKIEPLIIKGQITNCPKNYLAFSYLDKNDEEFYDTIKLDATGKFYLKTYKIQVPQRIVLQQRDLLNYVVFVAPGYNLSIRGNGKDMSKFEKSRMIAGIGAKANRYTFLIDSVNGLTGGTIGHGIQDFSELRDFVFYLNQIQKMQDSIAGIVFDENSGEDTYLKYFGNMVRTDNQFNTNYFIVQYLTNITRLNSHDAIIYLKANFNNYLPANLSKDEYLHSWMFKFFMDQYFVSYVLASSKHTDSSLKVKSLYNFEAIKNNYTGKVQEYLFYFIMKMMTEDASTFERLNKCQDIFIPYQKIIKNSYYKKVLEEAYAKRQKELMLTQIGMPAPSFTLEDNFSNKHKLSDFKGKVVYMDMWASWCGPCRAETPAFKILYDKYKNDDRVAFISIAVMDSIGAWKKALEKDKPGWLQLIDTNSLVQGSYDANSIPKFILVNKGGNIINFDAPRPSNVEEIEKLINQEITK